MLNEKIIKEIISTQEEGMQLEFKDYSKMIKQDIYETVCSFSNRLGGIIIIGISDEKPHEIVGINEEYIEQMQKDFSNTCANPEKISPRQILGLEKYKIDDKYILAIEIYPTPYVCKLNKYEILDRKADGDYRITDNYELIQQMEIRKCKMDSESEIFPYCSIADFREEVINKARNLAIANNENHP